MDQQFTKEGCRITKRRITKCTVRQLVTCIALTTLFFVGPRKTLADSEQYSTPSVKQIAANFIYQYSRATVGESALLGLRNSNPYTSSFVSWNQRQQRSTRTQSHGYSLLNLPSAQLALSKLASTVSFNWSGRELRTGLRELSQTFNVSIWLDRRIDPNTSIDFQVEMDSVSLWQALGTIAEQASAKPVLIENVVCFAPTESADRIARSAAMLHVQLSQQSSGQAVGQKFSWPELSSSNDILSSIARQWSIQISGELPHDLFHAGELPTPCTLATQLTLLAGGFELEASSSGNGLRLETLGSSTTWKSVYPKSALNVNAARRTSIVNIRRQYPGSKYAESNGHVELQGPADYHVAMLLPKSTKRRNTPSDILKQRWGFEVANHSAEMVIEYLSKQIGFQLKWSAACTPASKAQVITLKVDQASLDDILTAFNDASELRATRSGLVVTIQPK